MGLFPDLLPGYGAVVDPEARAIFETCWRTSLPSQPGWTLDEMLTAVEAGRLEALYVVGANPLKGRDPAQFRSKTFVVVQDLFLHETAQAADVVLPAASAYEKSGTVTNTCGELQRLREAMEVMGARTDLEILSRLAAAMEASAGPYRVEDVFAEIRQVVPGYSVSPANLLAGGAEPVPTGDGFQRSPILQGGTVPPSGIGFPFQSIPAERAGRVYSAEDTLFTSGTVGRFSPCLQTVPERDSRPQPDPA